MGNALLLSLVRSPTGIFACVSKTSSLDSAPVVSIIPLAQLDRVMFPARDALLADWLALGAARSVEDVWPALWRVFWATLSLPEEAAPALMPKHITTRRVPVATAAHPRAFRGTKFQPPKSASMPLDLHAWLAYDRLLDGLFARHDFRRWPVLGPDGCPMLVELHNRCATVRSVLATQGIGTDENYPDAFTRHFLWLLKAQPRARRMAWASHWRAVGSPQQGDMLTLLAHLCALDAGAHGWAGMACSLSPARQASFLRRLLDRAVFRLPASSLSMEQLCAFDALCCDDIHFDAHIDVAFDNLSRGVDIAYTLIGCHLPTSASGIEAAYRSLRATASCPDVPVGDIARMLGATGDSLFWARSAWQSCALQPGFSYVLTHTAWESLTPEAAVAWMELFRLSEWDFDNPAQFAEQWNARRAMFSQLHHHLLQLDRERQMQYVAMLRDFVCGWNDALSLRQCWPVLLPLMASWCRAPFSGCSVGDLGLSAMAMHLPPSGWHALARTPQAGWLKVEQACRRENDVTLIRYGLTGATKALPEFVLRAFGGAPKRLMRSMALIGCLEYHSRRRLLAQAARSPWFATAWEELVPLTACTRLLALCTGEGIDSPLPRRLRKHLAGQGSLTQAQLARHCRVTLARLYFTQLAALDAMAWRHIDGPFDLRTQSKAAHHAVRLHASIDGGNRKALRRFLLGYAQGGVHAYLDHPLNRAWYAAHPRINAATWSADRVRHSIEEAGITIAIETDPLEVLMMGSYVGSCLGLGGLCEYSSVACLVDANKQVVYARDTQGRVVARQLLAIDERERLVCFEVYPSTTNDLLLEAFSQFDQALASALGIPVYRSDDDGYQVKIILAMEWWDDGQWNGMSTQSVPSASL